MVPRNVAPEFALSLSRHMFSDRNTSELLAEFIAPDQLYRIAEQRLQITTARLFIACQRRVLEFTPYGVGTYHDGRVGVNNGARSQLN